MSKDMPEVIYARLDVFATPNTPFGQWGMQEKDRAKYISEAKHQLTENRAELAEEDVEVAHMNLDDLGLPRTSGSFVYTIKGRIDLLNEKHQAELLAVIDELTDAFNNDFYDNHFNEVADSIRQRIEGDK